MAIEAIPQYSYNLGNVNFGSLTGVNRQPQEQVEKGQQYQAGLNSNYQIKPVSQPIDTFEGIERLQEYQAQGYDPYEIQNALSQAYEEMDGKGINEVFAQKPINDDGELSPTHDGFALYC